MAMDYHVQRCAVCGQDYIHSHYCEMRPLTQKAPWIHGTVPAKNLTEEDVRRIVREELAKMTHNAELTGRSGDSREGPR